MGVLVFLPRIIVGVPVFSPCHGTRAATLGGPREICWFRLLARDRRTRRHDLDCETFTPTLGERHWTGGNTGVISGKPRRARKGDLRVGDASWPETSHFRAAISTDRGILFSPEISGFLGFCGCPSFQSCSSRADRHNAHNAQAPHRPGLAANSGGPGLYEVIESVLAQRP